MSKPDPNALESFLRLIPASDLASGRLRLDPGCSPGLLTRDSAMAFLAAQSVSAETIDPAGVEELVRLAGEQPKATHTVLVCTSLAPVPGEDGRFELVPALQARMEEVAEREAQIKRRHQRQESAGAPGGHAAKPAHEPSPGEHVDFYNQSAFVIILRGDRLGRLCPPTEGREGVDIFGKVIPTRHGKPFEVKFDKTITIDDDRVAYAGVSGRLHIDRAEARIDEVLQIDGPVSFVTGNIDFPGDVNIAGGVKDHFVVRSGGSVAIRELVEACTIECRGDLHMVVGIAGREKAEFSVGGEISARYIEACKGSVTGNAEISGEITNCTLLLEGHLVSPTCAVRGGEISVAGRVDINTLGSEQGVPTLIHAASLHGLDHLLDHAMKIGPHLINAIERIDTRIESTRSLDTHDEHTESILVSLEAQRAEKNASLDKLATGLERMLEVAGRKTEVNFMVRKIIHPGAVITFKGWRAEFEQNVRGPIHITVNSAGRPMATGPGETTPKSLDRFARVIEDPSSVRLEIAQARVAELRKRGGQGPAEPKAQPDQDGPSDLAKAG